MEFEFASSLTLLAGCTTAYLEGFEFHRDQRHPSPPQRPVRVEPMIARILTNIEADLRLAGLGLVAPLAP
jgi:hypothetical protein